MSKELLIQSIKSYLYSQPRTITNVYTVEQSFNFNYISIYFRYLKEYIEIRIYSSTFIKVRINNKTVKNCSDIHSLRQAIDDLQIYLWEY